MEGEKANATERLSAGVPGGEAGESVKSEGAALMMGEQGAVGILARTPIVPHIEPDAPEPPKGPRGPTTPILEVADGGVAVQSAALPEGQKIVRARRLTEKGWEDHEVLIQEQPDGSSRELGCRPFVPFEPPVESEGGEA